MKNKLCFWLYIIFIIFIFSNVSFSKFNDINKLTNIVYTTHIYSYEIPYEWLKNIKTSKNFFLASAGSISSDEFVNYRHFNFFNQLTKSISFQYYYFIEDNQDFTKKDSIMQLNYHFNETFKFGFLGEVDRQKEYCDIGFDFDLTQDLNNFYKFRVLFKEFQYNKKSNSDIEYLKSPVEYSFDIFKNFGNNEKINIISSINFTPEYSNRDILSDTINKFTEANFTNYTYLKNFFNISKAFLHKIRLIYKNEKRFFPNATLNNNFKMFIIKNEFKILSLKNFEKFSLGFNIMYNRTKNLFPNNVSGNIKYYKKSFTPLIEYQQLFNEKFEMSHTLYTTLSKLKTTANININKYFLKYRFNFLYKFNKDDSINVILSLEKEESESPAFGGGCLQLIFKY